MGVLHQLVEHGQSYWLDNLTRQMIAGGELKRRVAEEGLRGVTSNPAIFHKAISQAEGYDEQIETLVRQGLAVSQIYEALVVADIQAACDILQPVYLESRGLDGYVSLEISPYLAHDTDGSLTEARRLHRLVDRANVFIKIPGTRAGFRAIEEALFDGININITLLFSIAQYNAVANAYIAALERRAAAGRRVDDVVSVASFFLSRIDVLVDELLGHRIQSMPARHGPRPEELFGKVAVANAKLAYQRFIEVLNSERWKALEAQGARVQRLLWASTSTKDPLYDAIRYVEPLIGPHTVNTMPDETIRAFAERGVVATTIERDLEEARAVLERFAALGIDLDNVTWQLENEGIEKFLDPFDALMAVLAGRRQSILEGEIPVQSIQTGAATKLVEAGLEALDARQFGRRLFTRDPSLWTSDPAEQSSIRRRLGWVDIAADFRSRVADLTAFADGVRADGIAHVVLLGMGGSSLSAETTREIFGRAQGWPELLVLDSTNPMDISYVERDIDPANTLFVVASKSGTTIETLSLYRYFWNGARHALHSAPGSRFIAITDSGTPLAVEARRQGFRRVFENPESVGGRYSALSYFGLVPMALLGLDIGGLLDRALVMQRSCGPFIPATQNPGVVLGVLFGLAARNGRDKITFAPSPSLAAFATWAEQLLAESTGKAGHGLIPVVGERARASHGYADDRLFVNVRLITDRDPAASAFLDERAAEGHPTVRIELTDPLDLGAEFLRWQLAAAVAGSVLGVNPFDEPNVAESKRNTRELVEEWTRTGSFAEGTVLASNEWLMLYGERAQPWLSPENTASENAASSESILQQFLASIRPRDYFAILAYISQTHSAHELLTFLRQWVGHELRVATTLGYGPRYLHSTGQLHKGGPNSGVFLLVTADPEEDRPIPDEPYGFGALHQAQALGDYRALVDKHRRVLRVHLHGDSETALRHLCMSLEGALAREAAKAP